MKELIHAIDLINKYEFLYIIKYKYFNCIIELKTNHQSEIDYCNKYFPTTTSDSTEKVGQSIKIIQDNKIYNILERSNIDNVKIIKRCYNCYGEMLSVYFLCNKGLSNDMITAMILPEYNRNVDIFVFRLLREHLIIALINQGWVIFHAAMVEKDGKGIAILGDKNVGKTASTMKLVKNGTFNFVSNDKIMIKVNKKGNLEVISVPISMGIREQVYQLYYDSFKKFDCNYGGNHIKYMGENTVLIEKKHYFTVHEIIKIMNTNYVNHCILTSAYSPRFDEHSGKCYKVLFQKEELLEFLQRQVIYPKSKGFDFLYMIYNVSYDASEIKRLIQQLMDMDVYKITHNDRYKEEYINLVQKLS